MVKEFIKKKSLINTIIGVMAILIIFLSYRVLFSAPNKNDSPSQFINPPPSTIAGEIAIEGYGVRRLKAEGFIKNIFGFEIVFSLIGGHEILPGAYQVSSSMNAWQIAKIMKDGPNLVWVTIPEGLRKEQIADLLAAKLSWSDEDKKRWVTISTSLNIDYLEGVYFPDTYLLPINETPAQVALRMQRNFEEKFAPFAKDALAKNFKWTTVLKMASLIQREAAGKDDMPLIAGILWNRLDRNMRLDIDSTVQYIRDNLIHYGKAPTTVQAISYTIAGGWWSPIVVADKLVDSPFNTYIYKGLPPHPISNPGADAIEAVINPEKTDCLYYLHDASRIIHCSKTLQEHKANIAKYLH
jgi:conserved hypothetical protein, YceG family